jgi:hypothetical protein
MKGQKHNHTIRVSTNIDVEVEYIYYPGSDGSRDEPPVWEDYEIQKVWIRDVKTNQEVDITELEGEMYCDAEVKEEIMNGHHG